MLSLLLLFASSVSAGSQSTETCTYSEGKKIIKAMKYLQNCAANNYCIEGNDDDGRRRLEGDEYVGDWQEKTGYQTYNCYCKNCQNKMEALQELCNSCDTPNYLHCDDDYDDCDEQEEGDVEESFFALYCTLNRQVVVNHADSFCGMMIGATKVCLKEMEYMVNPPEEDDNNNGRRRLENNDDEEVVVDAADILKCWSAPFAGANAQENYRNLEACKNICEAYGNSTYSYMNDYDSEPVQTCGMSVGYSDENAEANDYLPHSVQHQGIMCGSSQCTSDDMGLISDYLVKMAAYGDFMNFCGEEGECGEQEGGDDDRNLYISGHSIPETRGSWRCEEEAAGGEGMIENENFPDECSSSTPTPSQDKEEGNTTGGSSTTATIFAIICGLGMGVFMCLFIYYYRLAVDLRTGKVGGQSLMGATGNSQNVATNKIAYQQTA